MGAIDQRETQKPSLGFKKYSPKSFYPGVHLKFLTLGNPLFCAWCAYTNIIHMKILNSFTKLIKQWFDFNDHQDIPQNWLTVLYFQIHPKSTTFQGKNWYEMWWILRNFQRPRESHCMSLLKMLLERHKEHVQSNKFL